MDTNTKTWSKSSPAHDVASDLGDKLKQLLTNIGRIYRYLHSAIFGNAGQSKNPNSVFAVISKHLTFGRACW